VDSRRDPGASIAWKIINRGTDPQDLPAERTT